eukprot:322859-Prorocentrum_minimum.AAC.4
MEHGDPVYTAAVGVVLHALRLWAHKPYAHGTVNYARRLFNLLRRPSPGRCIGSLHAAPTNSWSALRPAAVTARCCCPGITGGESLVKFDRSDRRPPNHPCEDSSDFIVTPVQHVVG